MDFSGRGEALGSGTGLIFRPFVRSVGNGGSAGPRFTRESARELVPCVLARRLGARSAGSLPGPGVVNAPPVAAGVGEIIDGASVLGAYVIAELVGQEEQPMLLYVDVAAGTRLARPPNRRPKNGRR